MKRLQVQIPEDMMKNVKHKAVDEGKTMTELVQLALSKLLNASNEQTTTKTKDSELLKSVDGELMRELKKKAEEDEVPVPVLVQYALMHVLNNPDPYTIYEVEEDCYTPPVPTYDDIYADELRRIDELNRPSDPNPFNRND